MKNNYFLLLLIAFVSTIFLISCNKTSSSTAITPPVVPPVTPPIVTKGKSFYVSANIGVDASSGLSVTTPFKSINRAHNSAVAGDTIFIMDGLYSFSVGSTLNITTSGTADKWITYKAYLNHKPKIFCAGSVWNAITINGSYIVFEGIEVYGNNAGLTYTDALASYNNKLAGGTDNNRYAIYNTNGISIGGPNAESKFPHHITIRNCNVHDFPGGGISSIQADYTIIEGNTVYNNAWYMMYAGSGISIYGPINSDGADINKYKNIVRNNICYGNKTTIPWISIVPARLSDGNGIIIDVNQYPYNQTTVTNKPYTGRTLVENNLSYNNGGSGIHAYKADYVDIINNTSYGNGTVVGYGEIFAGDSKDVKIINNIMYARTGGKCNENTRNTNVVYDFNIYFNGTTAVLGANDKRLNPLFVLLSVDPLTANFSINLASPAADAGTKSIYAAKDIKGVTRPLGVNVDCGAYEVK